MTAWQLDDERRAGVRLRRSRSSGDGVAVGLTRSSRATCRASAFFADIAAACSHTCSRRDWPSMVSPPLSVYLMAPD